MVRVTTTQVFQNSGKAARDETGMNEVGAVPVKLYLWARKFEFHTIFMCREILFLVLILFKNVKTILNLQAIRNQASPRADSLRARVGLLPAPPTALPPR